MGDLTSTLTIALKNDGLAFEAKANAEAPGGLANSADVAKEPRALDRGWRERHIEWQARGLIPPGKTPLLHEDMTPVFDRRGRTRMWSQHVAAAMQPGRRSSRTIAQEAAKAAEAERLAAEVAKLRAQVLRSLRPPAGKLWSVHGDALLLIGPSGGIPVSAAAASLIEPLAAGGRRVLEEHDQAGLAALAGRLAVVGLRIDRRREGVRIARAKPVVS